MRRHGLLLVLSLLGTLAHAEEDVVPRFESISPQRLEAEIRVVSARNYAFFGFNTPEVQIHLPALDNSAYARIEMAAPVLTDEGGTVVPYELEHGLYDHDTKSNEIRFGPQEGSEQTIVFARATGTIELAYPLAVTTLTVTPKTPDPHATVADDHVDVREDEEHPLPEAAPFCPVVPVRAYDAAGQRLEATPMVETRVENGRTTRRFSFEGKVARAEVDTVDGFVELTIDYALPPAAPLPDDQSGQAPEVTIPVAPTPGGRVTIHRQVRAEVAAAGRAAIGTPPGPPTPAAPPMPPPPPPTPAAVASPQPPPAPRAPLPTLPSLESLSPKARAIAVAITALEKTIPPPIRVVQLVAFEQGIVSILQDDGGGRMMEYVYREGAVGAPSVADTRYLDCKQGLGADALDLARIAPMWDDAERRGGGDVLQIVVGQYPCGTAYINVPAGRARVLYDGSGRFLKVD